MLQDITLTNFKGFRRFRLKLGARAVLVGPNNAGKSTAIGAIRAIAGMRVRGSSSAPGTYVDDGTVSCRAWTLPRGYGLDEENLRYDFLPDEVRLQARFKSGASLTAVWPAGEEDDDSEDGPEFDDPYFYFRAKNGLPIVTAKGVRQHADSIGVVPILTPIDLHEVRRARDTVVRNLSGRLASRHFRNQLLLLAEDETADGRTAFDEFIDFAEPWLFGTKFDPPQERRVEGGTSEVDVFFYENRRPRELAWAGDGFQVFLQLLYHCYRLRDSKTLVLDEPDVYLHPDLQRRFFQVVDAHLGQVIFASHSSELVAEAPPKAVIWVDRTRRSAVPSPDPRTLEDLTAALGSGFNLRLARVLRAKCVLFVEGGDLAILRELAKTLGLSELVSERSIATVELGGAAGRSRLESFGWIADALLQGAVVGHVLLDRDYRTVDIARAIERQLRDSGLQPHVWRRKEIESYLLQTSVVARATGAPEEWVDDVLEQETGRLRGFVLSRMAGAMHHDRLDRSLDVATVTEKCSDELDSFWSDALARRWRCPAKDLIAVINRRAMTAGYQTIEARELAREVSAEEIDSEMKSVLVEINGAAAG